MDFYRMMASKEVKMTWIYPRPQVISKWLIKKKAFTQDPSSQRQQKQFFSIQVQSLLILNINLKIELKSNLSASPHSTQLKTCTKWMGFMVGLMWTQGSMSVLEPSGLHRCVKYENSSPPTALSRGSSGARGAGDWQRQGTARCRSRWQESQLRGQGRRQIHTDDFSENASTNDSKSVSSLFNLPSTERGLTAWMIYLYVICRPLCLGKNGPRVC